VLRVDADEFEIIEKRKVYYRLEEDNILIQIWLTTIRLGE